jgi:hypothetical protein
VSAFSKKIVLFLFLVISLLLLNSCRKEDLPGANDFKPLGSSAHQFLSSTPYSVLKIELHYMPGYEPDGLSLSNLVSFLKSHLNKPLGIQLVSHPVGGSGKASLTLKDIISIEKAHRDFFTEDNKLTVHILITDGDFSNPNTFATSYWNTSFCVFGKTVSNYSGSFGQISRSNLLSTVLQHEFCHLLGLVGQGSEMQVNHRDAAKGAHCNNSTCLMYFGVVSTVPGNVDLIPVLDANCIKDLSTNGGK